MLSGINALMVRARDRTELLNETCRLAVVGGGYATALVYLESPGVGGMQDVGQRRRRAQRVQFGSH